MKKQKQVTIVVVLFFIIGFFYFVDWEPSVSSLKKQGDSNLKNSKTAQMMTAPPSHVPEVPVTNPTSTITLVEIKTLNDALPKTIVVRSEVEENPHITPKSLISFAKNLGPLIERALVNSEDATLLVNELNKCALNDEVAQAARALCLSKSEKLAGVYPQLNEQVSKTRQNASQEVIKILNNRNI